MQTIVLILAIASVGIACFTLMDYALLRRLRDASLRRIGLSLAMLSVLLVPLIGTVLPVRLPWLAETIPTETSVSAEMLIALSEVSAEIDSTPVEMPWWQQVDWANLIGWLWIVGVGVATLMLIVRLVSLGRLISSSYPSERYRGIEVRLYKSEHIPPFSTMGRIFIPEHLAEGGLRQHILLHEASHVESWHMLDSLLAEIFCIIYWFHPLAYVLRHEQRTNLEYCADKDVVDNDQVNKRAYQLDLISMCASSEAFPLCLSFHTKEVLKQRIIMMNQSQSPRTGLRWGLMLALPIIGAMLSVANALATPAESSSTEITLAETTPTTAIAETPSPQGGDPIYEVVDTPAQFPGGQAAMMQWIATNIKYPQQAIKENVSGRVFVQFVVDKDGTILSPELIRGAHPALDAEALRIVKAMPRWIPGKHAGKAVKTKFTIPVSFSLSADKDNGDEVYEVTHEDAQFPGGKAAMMQWIAKQMKYPEEAVKQNISGRTFVSFVINQDGSISDAQIVRSVHPALDQEALRVVQAMPNWIPGKLRGKAAKTKFTIPISFSLSADKPKAENQLSSQLILIDGKKASQEEMAQLDPSKIASVQVIKNEDATATYGEQGKNGVISITTKADGTRTSSSTIYISRQDTTTHANLDNILVIVDGKEVARQEMNALSPDKIETVNVLKDKAATAIYGDRAQNGVIIITLKKGQTSTK